MIGDKRFAGGLLLIVAAILPRGAAGQVANGGFEVPQVPGTTIAAPWTEAGGSGSDIVTAATVPSGQAFGFPVDGTQWLRLSSFATGAMTDGCGQVPVAGVMGPGTAGWVTQAFTVTGSTVLNFRFTFLTFEDLSFGAASNDYFAADILDPATTPPALLARMVYVDLTGALCVTAGVNPPLSFSTPAGGPRELLPAGPKCASYDLATIPGIGLGSSLILSFHVANRGNASVNSLAYVDGVNLSDPPAATGQFNSSAGSLRVNGVGATSTCHAPYAATCAAGGPLAITVTGGALSPFALFVGPLNPGNMTTLFGQVDIGTPPTWADVALLMDGFNGSGFFGPFARTGIAGSATFTFTVPSAPPFTPGFVLGTFQGIVARPGAIPWVLTAAIRVTVQ